MAARSVVALVSVADVVAGDLADHLDRRGHDVRQARQPWEAESLLSAGGTKHYSELLAPFGLDAGDPAFWQIGLSMIERLIGELEAMEQAA